MNGIIDAVELAYLIVNISVDNQNFISNLKLQKLLYLMQVACIREFKTSLFDNRIEAWKYGPVVPEVYREFSKFGGGVIDQKISREEYYKDHGDIKMKKRMIDNISDFISDDEVIDLINHELSENIGSNPWDLVLQTHRQGGAWEVRYSQGANTEITTDDIRNIELNA